MNTPPVSLDSHIVIALVLLGFAGFCLRVSESGRKDWARSTSAIKPSLDAKNSPMMQVFSGVRGLIQHLLFVVVAIILLLLGIDQLVFEGYYGVQAWDMIQTYLA